MDLRFNENGYTSGHDAKTYLSWANSLRLTLRELGFENPDKPAPDPTKSSRATRWPDKDIRSAGAFMTPADALRLFQHYMTLVIQIIRALHDGPWHR
jgi:hypothetical protein